MLRNGKILKLKVVFQGADRENGEEAADGSVAFYGAYIKEAPREVLEDLGLRNGVQIVELGQGKLMDAGAREGFIILYVNDQPVKTPQDVINIVKKSKRSVFVEGVTPSGRSG